jgi:hypothetical protein
MATVRFSDALKGEIRNNAKAMFKQNIDKAKADVPAHWADKIYQGFFPADDIAKFNALPAHVMAEKQSLDFEGFFNAPEDVFQTATHKQKAYECSTIKLEFSKDMRWPADIEKMNTGFKFQWRNSKADYNDSRWAWLVPEFKEYVRKIFEQESKEASFLEGVDKLMETYSTLAPAIKAWPALWDLVPDEAKERHKKVVERVKKDASDVGVDLNSMTAAVTFSKLTR